MAKTIKSENDQERKLGEAIEGLAGIVVKVSKARAETLLAYLREKRAKADACVRECAEGQDDWKFAVGAAEGYSDALAKAVEIFGTTGEFNNQTKGKHHGTQDA